MIEQLMNEYGYRESGTDDLLMPHVLTDSNSVGYGGGVESLTEGSWPFDQPSAPNGSTPMATLDAQSYFPEPEPPTPPAPTSKYMYFEAAKPNSTIAFITLTYSAPSHETNFEYSRNGKNWEPWKSEMIIGSGSSTTYEQLFETITIPKKGGRIYLKGVNPNGLGGSWFGLTGSLYCHGNAQSLVDGDEPTLVAKSMPKFWHYEYLVGEQTALLSAPELPATTLVNSCYNSMFADCTSLTQAPERLPATTLANGCYSYMFYNCTSLTEAPQLPATTLANYCYNNMFANCTSLTQAPELPATTLAENCYSYMFAGCKSLTLAPELQATTLAAYCYHEMFYGCKSLTEAPELPATTLARSCYESMFSHCTSLTQAPELPATTLVNECYYSMFQGCTSLTQAPERLPATTLEAGCYRYMFAGCTSLIQAPVMPATTLANSCYESMFAGCTSLTQAPELPATTLIDNCYKYMFGTYYDNFDNIIACTSLSNVTCLATDISAWDCVNNWLYGVAQSGTFTKAASMSGWTTGASGIPDGWTVQDYAG